MKDHQKELDQLKLDNPEIWLYACCSLKCIKVPTTATSQKNIVKNTVNADLLIIHFAANIKPHS